MSRTQRLTTYKPKSNINNCKTINEIVHLQKASIKRKERMSQLIQMRRRIRAIETIKKVTQAMRIISMSTHTRLKKQIKHMDEYKENLYGILNLLKKDKFIESNSFFTNNNKAKKTLIILVSAQKGLSGNFNQSIFKYFSKVTSKEKISIICIGKKAKEFVRTTNHNIIKSYNSISSPQILETTQDVFNLITNTESPYTSVQIFSNISSSFFSQKAQHSQIIPINLDNKTKSTNKLTKDIDEYNWEQSQEDIFNHLTNTHIKITLQDAIFQSLLAEQAARFISMDSSTQNAKNMLTEMKLAYNKIRQAKITRELTDLSGSFQMN